MTVQDRRTKGDVAANSVAEPEPGRYRHYKGTFYEVIGVARHSETEEKLVVYRCLYGDHSLWARPLAMFMESVIIDGRRVPRFSKCEVI